jgi:hypothetical protein
MADESVESRDAQSERSGQYSQDGKNGQPGASSNRRRILITSLLAAPTVVTLNARSARGGKPGKDPSANCTASLQANPHASHPCGVLPG